MLIYTSRVAGLIVALTGLSFADGSQQPSVFRPVTLPDDSPVFVAPPVTVKTVAPADQQAVIIQAKMIERAGQIVQDNKLPITVAGFSDRIAPDEEYKLYQGRNPDEGAILLNRNFWIKKGYYDSDSYLHYVLFRASADYFYRRYFDADRFAWAAEGPAEVMRTAISVFRESSNSTVDQWQDDTSIMSPRAREFRQSLDHDGDPAHVLQALTRYAFQAIEQRAADEWAVRHYHKVFKEPETALISKRVNERERALAWDFNRATSAMLLGERVVFRETIKHPVQYVNQGSPTPAPPPATLVAKTDSNANVTTDPLLDDPNIGVKPTTNDFIDPNQLQANAAHSQQP